MKIHVSNLSIEVIDSDLFRLFSPFGEVLSAMVTRDRVTGRSRGTALLEMPVSTEAKQAILLLDNKVVMNRRISVSAIM